jgi:hypothetical protein
MYGNSLMWNRQVLKGECNKKRMRLKGECNTKKGLKGECRKRKRLKGECRKIRWRVETKQLPANNCLH